ncbi:MAG: DUF4476 domain-containing protein [Bacteroidota bacterium]
MTELRFIILLLFLGINLSAQTKLIVYSENNEQFIAEIDNIKLVKEVSNFFELETINKKSVVLNIKMENTIELKKTISLKKSRQNVYAISNENGIFKIRYRGNYHLKEKLPNFISNTEKKSLTKANSHNLMQLNKLIEAIDNTSDEKVKELLIIKELQNGIFNCRQLKFLFTKLNYDSSKLKVFRETKHNCMDIINYSILLNQFKDPKTKEAFSEIVFSAK